MSTSVLKSTRLPFQTRGLSARLYSTRKGEVTNSDPQKDIIRRYLYPANIRNKATPTGTWRPDVARALQRAIPSVQAHETIERAWLLHQRHLRKKRDAELQRKFQCMKQAMQELEEIDSRLFREANKQEDPRARSLAEVEAMKSMSEPEKRAVESRVRGLFPRELRVPTDTPPKNGWPLEWRAFQRPLA